MTRKLGIAKTLSEYEVVTSWSAIVGEQIAKVTKAEHLEKGILFVSVATAPWRNELTMQRQEIVARINDAVGKDVVKEIRFR